MNKKRLTISAIIFIVICVLIFIFTQSKGSDDLSTQTTNTTNSQESTSGTPSKANSSLSGTYEKYDPAKLASSNASTKVLFFHAEWCPQCIAIEKGINAGGVPNNVSIFKVDYDNSTDLREKYGVTLQTTFVVVDDDGKMLKKHVAYSEPTFEAVKKAIL